MTLIPEIHFPIVKSRFLRHLLGFMHLLSDKLGDKPERHWVTVRLPLVGSEASDN